MPFSVMCQIKLRVEMADQIIHFVHANGFPAQTYRKLFDFLAPEYKVQYKNLHAHEAHYPVTDNWQRLVQELIDYLDHHYNAPVIGLGHSFGGLIVLLAAVERPDLFQSIVLLDSTVLCRIRCYAVKVAKRVGLIDRLTGGRISRLRRTRWRTYEDAVEYFRKRILFKNFEEETLYDYVYYGTYTNEKGEVRLKFDPHIEYQIYRTLPDNLAHYYNRLKVPGALLYGKHTHALNRMDLRQLRKFFQLNTIEMPGSHLFPFEYPEKTAEQIKAVISELRTSGYNE